MTGSDLRASTDDPLPLGVTMTGCPRNGVWPLQPAGFLAVLWAFSRPRDADTRRALG